MNEKQVFIAGYKLALKQWTSAGDYPVSHAEEQYELWKKRQAESKEN